MTLIEQTDRALALAANQFAGHSIVLDKLVHDIITTTLPNGGVFVAAFCWIWFETDETGVHGHRRNVVTALLAVVVVAGAVWLLKALLPFRGRPLHDSDVGLRVPFGVDPISLNDLGAFPSGHTAFFRPQRSTVGALTLVGRSGSRLDIVDDLLVTAIPRRPLA